MNGQKLITFDYEDLERQLAALASKSFEELCEANGAYRIHDGYYMTVEQSEEIVKDWNETFPEWGNFKLERSLVDGSFNKNLGEQCREN